MAHVMIETDFFSTDWPVTENGSNRRVRAAIPAPLTADRGLSMLAAPGGAVEALVKVDNGMHAAFA